VKILLSAIACNPYWGSEASIGWKVAKCIARHHEVWVLTSEDNRENMTKGIQEGLVPENMHVHYCGKEAVACHPNRMIARLKSWTQYLDFSRSILPAAMELHRQVGFDLVHHVTYATWRVPIKLWKMPVPFVWGPLGGNERFPLNFMPMLSPATMAFEFARYAANAVGTISRNVRQCARNSTFILASNADAWDKLHSLRGNDKGLHRLLVTFFTPAELAKLNIEDNPKPFDGTLKLFCSGNLEGRKGVALAIRGLAIAKKQGVKFSYRIGSQGPESDYLRRLVKELGLEQDVVFGEQLPREGYVEELKKTHVYLLPSLRDNAPSTLMEAMLAGCVPIVAECGGPAEIVNADCGFPIPVKTPDQIVSGVAEALTQLYKEPERIAVMGRNARERIRNHYCEDYYWSVLSGVYDEALKLSSVGSLS